MKPLIDDWIQDDHDIFLFTYCDLFFIVCLKKTNCIAGVMQIFQYGASITTMLVMVLKHIGATPWRMKF